MGAAEPFEEVGAFKPGVVDGTLVDEELVFREDDHHVVKTAAHNLAPVVQAGGHHTVTQADTLAVASQRCDATECLKVCRTVR